MCGSAIYAGVHGEKEDGKACSGTHMASMAGSREPMTHGMSTRGTCWHRLVIGP